MEQVDRLERREPPAAPRFGLIVAHGSPADPAPQEAVVAAIAAATARLCPFPVAAATLAAPGALAAAVRAAPAGAAIRVWPLFISDGWFVSDLLPRRLTEAGASADILAPFGLDPALPALCGDAAEAGARAHGLDPLRTRLLLAAHGSPSDPRPARAALAVADALRAAGRFGAVEVAFVEEPPFLEEGFRGAEPALCLPLFALAAGHVVGDLPEAAKAAGFTGPILPPIGLHPEVPALAAAALAS